MLVGSALLVAGSGARAAEGDLRNIGGNGPSTCELTLAELGPNLPTPASISGGNFKRSTGMRGIAVDGSGRQLFLAAAGRILSRGGIVAGGGTTVPTSEEGTPGASAAFGTIAGIAVDLQGTSLWVLVEPTPVTGEEVGRVFRVNLGPSGHTVYPFADVGPRPRAIAVDGTGNVYVAESTGDVRRLDALGGDVLVGSVGSDPTGIAVDATGSTLFVSTDTTVYRLTGTATNEVVAGSGIAHGDGGDPAMTARGLAIGHNQELAPRYLYIADRGQGRLLRVDLQASPRVITTVAGGGSTFVETNGTATDAALMPTYVAADLFGLVFIAAPEQCSIFELTTPPAFQLNTVVTNPAVPPTTVKPADPTSTGNPQSGSGPEVAANPSTQTDPGTVGSTDTGQPNETGIVSNTPAQDQTQILQQTTPDPAIQPTPQPTPTPTPSPTPTPTPDASGFTAPVNATPTPTPTPDPGATAGAAAEGGVVAPVSPPAPAPVPPASDPSPVAGSVAPPPAAQPVSNIGLAGGDGEAARGATRYAMVRSEDDESAVAALSMVLGGVVLAAFLCVMFVAPGASSKPKPRPKGAY